MRRLSTSRDKRVRKFSHMRDWTTRSHPSSSGTLRAWHQTCQTILFAPYEPVFYNRTCKPYSPVRLRAVLIQPPTSNRICKVTPSLPQRASTLRCPTTQPAK